MKNDTKSTVQKGKITILGKEYRIPQSWEEITVEKFLDLRAFADMPYDEAEFISIFIDCPKKELLKNDDPDFEYEIFKQLSWYRTKPIDFEKLLLPSEITIGDKKFKVPRDIGYKTYGQKISLQDRIKVMKSEDPVEIIPYALAIYFYNDYYGGDELPEDELINKFADEVCMKCSITEAYPVGYFFLMRFVESMSSKLNSLEAHILPKRRKQRFANLRSLASSKSLTP